MPAGAALHKGYPLALDGAGQDDAGLAPDGCRLGVGGLYGGVVMAVAGDDVPAEGRPFLIQGLGGHHIGGGAVNLQAIDVHDGAQVVQLELGRRHGRLPHLALLHLTVPQHGVDPVTQTVQLARQGHAHRGGHALAQAAGGHIHSPDMAHLRVAGQVPADGAELPQLVHGEIPPQGQGGVKGRGAVALAEHEAVPARGLGILGVDPHHVLIQDGE